MNQFSSEIDRQIEAEELREQLKAQGESLNIEEDIKKIQSTVNEALHQAEEFEPLPRNDEKDTSGNATLSNIQQRK